MTKPGGAILSQEKNLNAATSLKDQDFFTPKNNEFYMKDRIASAKEYQGAGRNLSSIGSMGIQKRFANNQVKSQLNMNNPNSIIISSNHDRESRSPQMLNINSQAYFAENTTMNPDFKQNNKIVMQVNKYVPHFMRIPAKLEKKDLKFF